ncbi:MAG: OsmC family protein [Halobacteriota archaeon]
MTDIETTTVSEAGYASTNHVGEYEFEADALGDSAPTPNAILVADYASCFLPAFRVGGQKEGVDDLGEVQIEAEGDLNDGDDLTAIRFTILVEADITDEQFEAIVDRAEDICHVHTALRPELRAEIDGHGDAF